MKVKNVIKNVFIPTILIIALILSLIPISNLVRPTEDNRYNLNGFYNEKKDSLDMVYIGGSACFVYWEPLRAFNTAGIASYNFANNAIVPQALETLLREAKKTQDPELFVVDLRPFQYGDKMLDDEERNNNTIHMYTEVPIRNTADNLKNSTNKIDFINKSVSNPLDRFSYYFDIAKYHSRWFNPVWNTFLELTGKWNHDYSTMDYVDNCIDNKLKGFYFVPKTKPETFTDLSDLHEEKELTGDISDCFTSLLEYCKSEDMKVLFIVHSYIQTEEDKMKYNYMERVIHEYGFDFLNTNDYYKEIGLDYSFDLYNENHVNVFGAEKYTDFLTDYILNHYDMPDHRDDPDYTSWHEKYNNFEKQVEETKNEIYQYSKEPHDDEE